MSQNNRERLRASQEASAKQRRLNRIIGVAAAILAVVLVGVFAVVLLQNQSHQTTASSVTPPNATSDAKSVVVNPGKAAGGAPVVELFFDYQCPVCKQFETIYGAALKALAASGKVELPYRTMTFLDTNLGNDASTRAGVAATCADVVGRYSDFHDEIYANQPETEGGGYDDALLRDTIPATVGITAENLTTFQSCYDQAATKAFVSGMNELASKDGVTGTPSFHVNGNDVALASFTGVTADGLGDLITKNA